MTTEEIIAEHLAQKGMALLDQISKDWTSKVSLRRLNIASTEHCLLAQAFGEGDWSDGVNAVMGLLDDAGITPDGDVSIMVDHGFTSGYHSFEAEEIQGIGEVSGLFIYSRDLTAAWIKVIGERRETFAAAKENP